MKLKSKADGFEFEAYHVLPTDARRGGLVLIQEIFGVTQGIKDLADAFAADGYEVLAPSMFDRQEPGFDVLRDAEGIAKGRDYMLTNGWDNAMGDVQACIDALKGPVFITGFCYGGTVAWLAASRCTGLSAASCYYGGGIAGLVDETPKVPVILHFGKKDAHITSEAWDKIGAAHPDTPLFLYEADHGFFSQDRADYDPEPARLSRLRTLQLFHKAGSGKVEA
ncbi:MAG: dienelactone hydrolase family protein [Phenylobacterium sp.]|nr:dienelactone hydrolase family protein [Phenylobacterium sp.]